MRFQATSLLHTTCVRSQRIWRASCVAANQKKGKKEDCAKQTNKQTSNRSPQTNKQTSVGMYSGSGRWCTFGRTASRATWPEWIYSQGFYLKPRVGGKVRIFGFYNNKKTKKRKICKQRHRTHNTARPYESCKNIYGLVTPICPFGAGTSVVQNIFSPDHFRRAEMKQPTRFSNQTSTAWSFVEDQILENKISTTRF